MTNPQDDDRIPDDPIADRVASRLERFLAGVMVALLVLATLSPTIIDITALVLAPTAAGSAAP